MSEYVYMVRVVIAYRACILYRIARMRALSAKRADIQK